MAWPQALGLHKNSMESPLERNYKLYAFSFLDYVWCFNRIHKILGAVVEVVDTRDLKSLAQKEREGSSPSSLTTFLKITNYIAR